MAELSKSQRTSHWFQFVRTGRDRLFNMLAVSHQTNGRSEGSERFQIANLRATGNQYSGPGEKQSKTCTRKHERQKTNKKVLYTTIFFLLVFVNEFALRSFCVYIVCTKRLKVWKAAAKIYST